MPIAALAPRSTLYDTPANRARLAASAGRIRAHAAVFDDLVARAVALHEAGQDDDAIQATAVAARVAHGAHTGRFASPALEHVLRDAGRRHVGAGARRARPRAEVQRVLHVLTETYHIGGHTRLARRWIDLDAGRCHSIFLTGAMQGVTDWLAEAAHRTGGATSICGGSESAIERARVLRAAAADADLVVVHAHPFDTVPALAFAEPEGRPPVVFMNHADHAFWLGAGVADGVVDFRPSGSRLSERGRGIAPERCHFLPLPLPPELPTTDRAASRAALRLSAGGPLLATVGSAYKYGAVLAPAFTDLAAAALEAVPDALLVAIGPAMDDAWRAVAAASGGRAYAVGFSSEAHLLLDAADVYLDAWPCSSGTAMLEAGLNGVPIVSLWPERDQPGHLATDIPSLVEHAVICTTPAEHTAAVQRLIADPDERARRGAALRETIHHQHAGQGWTDALERMIAAVSAAPPAPLPRDVAPGEPADWEATIEALHAHAGMGISADQAQRDETQTRRFPAGTVPPVRVLASPSPEPAAVAAVVDVFRDMVGAGRARQCVVAVEPQHLEASIALLETALAAGPDIDVDLVQLDTPGELVGAEDVCVAAPGSPLAAAAARTGALLRPVLG